MIALANRTGMDAWICIPHLADDDYVLQCAKLIKSTLNPDRKVYIEYTNEFFTTSFPQSSYIRDKGWELWPKADYMYARFYYYTRRAGEVFKIFDGVFAGQSARLEKVLTSQCVSSWMGGNLLKSMVDPAINPSGGRATVLSVAYYWGANLTKVVANNEVDTITPDELVTRSETDLDTFRPPIIKEYKALADQYGLRLCAYEGGLALFMPRGTGFTADVIAKLTPKIVEASRSPRLKDMYLKFFKTWADCGGSEFCHFSYVVTPARDGVWGVLEYQDQPIADAPRYQAMRQILGPLSPSDDTIKPKAPDGVRVETVTGSP
jgi:hypothetical protein